MRIVNCPIRDGLDFESWRQVLAPDVLLCVPGGTISQKPAESVMTDAEISALAALGNKVIYSVNLRRTPGQEVIELNRLLSAGIQIHSIRFGNENYGDEDIKLTNAIQANECFDYGQAGGQAYFDKTVAFKEAFAGYPGIRIYVGAYPSNQFFNSNPAGDRTNPFRKGFTSKVYELITPQDAIDFHVYDRFKVEGGIDFVSLEEYMADYPNPIYTIEAGVIKETLPDWPNTLEGFTPRSIYVMENLFQLLKGKHIPGVHLMERTTEAIGLVYQGQITEYGIAFKGLVGDDEVVIDDPNNPGNPNDPGNPDNTCVTILDIEPIVQGFFLGGLTFLKLMLSNGDIKNWWGFASNAPKVGECVEDYFPGVDFSKKKVSTT